MADSFFTFYKISLASRRKNFSAHSAVGDINLQDLQDFARACEQENSNYKKLLQISTLS